MSAIMGGHGSSAGTAGPRGTRRGTIRGTARGGGKMAGRGAGRGTGKRLSRAYSGGVNTPLINPKGIPNMSRSVHNNPAKVKRKYQKQKKAGNRGAVSRSNLTKRLSCIKFRFYSLSLFLHSGQCDTGSHAWTSRQSHARRSRSFCYCKLSHSSTEIRVASDWLFFSLKV